MSANEGHSIRGRRPGRCAPPSPEELETERILRQENIQRYIKRVLAGLPIFEDDPPPRARTRRQLASAAFPH